MRVGVIVRYGVSLAAAGGLLWWLFSATDFYELRDTLASGDAEWLALGLIVMLLSFALRALRWQLLIRASQAGTLSFLSAFWAMMSGYLVNFIFPRAGEVFRCTWLARRKNISFATSFGTVAAERFLDLLCLLLGLAGAVFVEYAFFYDWWTEHASFLAWEQLALGGAGVLLLAFGGYYLLRRRVGSALFRRIKVFVARFWIGLMGATQARPRWAFYGSTLSMWFFYFLGNYAFLSAYAPTAHLPPSASYVLMVVAGVGMALPLPGGVGSFHALGQATLVYYGIQESPALAVVTAIHLGYTLVVFLPGAWGVFAFFGVRHKFKRAPKQNPKP